MTYTDPFTDERRDAILADLAELEDGDRYTWLDGDPDVAWEADPEESYYASLREILLSAGWEKCYHRDGARLHYNVKLNGNDAYRGFRDAMNAARLHADAFDRVDQIADRLQQQEIEGAWEYLADTIRYEFKSLASAYSCGRSGGYVNIPQMETDGEFMVKLAQFLARQRAYMNSREFGEYLAEEAIEVDQEEQLDLLASPRIERIEA